MSYYIDIIDTTSPLIKVVVENASASGIVLKWNGGDKKDEMAIVTSEFNFDMLSKTAQDAAFIGFFTGDENKYKVVLKNSVDNAVVWTGYVLPDLYSEPYKNGCFFVSFTASDGLGRLKGKYLPDNYYNQEKSLIDIYCQILKLTGIDLNLYFNPAIENFTNKDWNTIYINTASFIDGKKKLDAFAILETLLQDTLCVCYQADNRWNIEGINTRNVRKVTYKIYNPSGVFVSTFVYDRLLKNITALPTPTITIIPPYNEITINHKKVEPFLPDTLGQETNDGWAIVTGVTGEIYASDWIANGGLYSKCLAPDYYCTVRAQGYYSGGNINFPQNDTQWISLKEKVFLNKGQKVKIAIEFKIKRPGISTADPANMNDWKNPFKYEIVFNNEVIFSNFGGIVKDNEKLIFDSGAVKKLEIEHIFVHEGLLDVKIYRPPGIVNNNRVEGIIINDAVISIIGFKDTETETDLISGDFTIDKTVDLTYGNDKSGFSNAFRLAKLKESSTLFNEIEVPILYIMPGYPKLAVVQLEGANLIKDNLYSTYKGGALVNILNVFYNYNNGEQMVIESDLPITSGSFFVKKHAVSDVISSRDTWLQWTDAIYKIENATYPKTVANIYRRMFNQAQEKLDVTALNAIKFNDIILFKYVYEKDFFVLNCAWNLDENKTTLTLGRSYYKDLGSTTPGDENVPPIVLAGDDIYIANGVTTASIVATAYDPDGYIASKVWTKTAGAFGDIIDTPFDLSTSFSNLTDDFYTYKIQVTDNAGATAMDTMNVIRIKDYTVTLDLVEETIEPAGDRPSIVRKYKLNFSPELLPGFVVTFAGTVYLLTAISGTFGVDAYSKCEIFKNGASIETREGYYPGEVIGITLNYYAGDAIFFELTTSAVAGTSGSGDTGTASAELKISDYTIVSGVGNIIGLPITKTQTVSVP
jgi:hypothetical protein